jgi:iron complex transport system substrate-binding protein
MKKYILFIILWLVLFCFKYNDLVYPNAEPKKQRIISLAPSTTEILFSLGLDEEIVGVSTFCNYPAQARDKEKVGTFSQPNIEKIISLKPDLIFATGLEQATTVEKLKRLKLNVYVSDPSNIQELFDSIKEIGKLVNKEAESEKSVSQMESKIEEIKIKVKDIAPDKKPRVFMEIWHDPLMTAGKGSFVDELINLAGGINIAYDTPRAYSYFSPEQVIKRNPDCIILGYMGEKQAIDTLKNRLGWKKIKAVINNSIYDDIDPDLFLRPGPRLIEGLEKIYKKLYPEHK